MIDKAVRAVDYLKHRRRFRTISKVYDARSTRLLKSRKSAHGQEPTRCGRVGVIPLRRPSCRLAFLPFGK
jgi:hypothetical protein